MIVALLQGPASAGPFFMPVYINTGDSNEARRAILAGSILNTGDSFERGRAGDSDGRNKSRRFNFGDLFS